MNVVRTILQSCFMSADRSTHANSQFERWNVLQVEFDWEAWSITLTSDPRFAKGILVGLMVKTVVTYLDLDILMFIERIVT